MPYAIERGDDIVSAVQQVIAVPSINLYMSNNSHQITLTSSDSDYILQLIPVIKEVRRSGRADELIGALNQLSAGKEAEIEKICSSNHQEFVGSVQQLLAVREGTVKLTSEILDLNQSIQASTENLAQQKKALVDSRSIRENIDE